MSDETTVTEGEIVDTVEAEPVETEEGIVLEAEEEAEETEEEEVFEFDLAGTKHQVKKGAVVDDLAEELQNLASNLHGDYTKKTQSTHCRA